MNVFSLICSFLKVTGHITSYYLQNMGHVLEEIVKSKSYVLFFNISSYKRFIPDSLNRNIRQRNILTRIRINNVFKKFLSEFNRRTVKDSNITLYDLKIKYLATLEGLTSGLGNELFEPISLSVTQEGDLCNGGYYGKVLQT